MSSQTAFADALLNPEHACPPGLKTWNGSDPAQRFGVYRNNVIVSLIDALADTFPVTQELVGEAFFRAMARNFACAHPPANAVLALYGDEFPVFIEHFPPAASLPYLADVARLEMLRAEAYHAANRPPLTAAQVAAMLSDPAALPGLRFTLHPSLRLLSSRFAVVSLWGAHQGLGDLSRIQPETAQTALILRVGLDVEILEISPTSGRFIRNLGTGMTFGAAAEDALGADPAFDLPGLLGELIRRGGFTAFRSGLA